MSNYKNASLVLRTIDLPLNDSNNFGSSNQFRTSFTWNNINLRTLLGDMYDMYDYFNLDIVQIASNLSTTATFGTTAADRNIIVKISGLPFINQTYTTKTGNNTNSATLCAFTFAPLTQTNTTLQTYNTTNLLTFGKNQDVCNITISYSRVDDLSVQTTVVGPSMVFIFTIHGITNEPSYKTNQRINFN